MRIAPLFGRELIDGVCRDLAMTGGRKMTEWTRINTPVGHQPFTEDYIPGALRESIRQKLLVVTFSLRGMVYESGCETNLSYAPYVEEGTGLYGPHRQMYEIRPKNPNGWLKFTDQKTGEVIFARKVMHPGSPGSHMFAIGAVMAEADFHLFGQRILQEWSRRQERLVDLQPPIRAGVRG